MCARLSMRMKEIFSSSPLSCSSSCAGSGSCGCTLGCDAGRATDCASAAASLSNNISSSSSSSSLSAITVLLGGCGGASSSFSIFFTLSISSFSAGGLRPSSPSLISLTASITPTKSKTRIILTRSRTLAATFSVETPSKLEVPRRLLRRDESAWRRETMSVYIRRMSRLPVVSIIAAVDVGACRRQFVRKVRHN